MMSVEFAARLYVFTMSHSEDVEFALSELCRMVFLVGPCLDLKLLLFLLKDQFAPRLAPLIHSFHFSPVGVFFTFHKKTLYFKKRIHHQPRLHPTLTFPSPDCCPSDFFLVAHPSPPCPSRYPRHISQKGLEEEEGEEEEEAQTGAGMEAAVEVFHEAVTNNFNDQTRTPRHQQHRSRIPVATSPLPALRLKLSGQCPPMVAIQHLRGEAGGRVEEVEVLVSAPWWCHTDPGQCLECLRLRLRPPLA